MGFHALPYCRWHRYYRRQTYSSCSLPWLEAGSPTLQTPPAHLPRFSLHPGIGIRIHSAATSYNRGYLVGKGTGQPVLKAPRSSHRSCPQQRMDGWMRLAFRALQLSPHWQCPGEGRKGVNFLPGLSCRKWGAVAPRLWTQSREEGMSAIWQFLLKREPKLENKSGILQGSGAVTAWKQKPARTHFVLTLLKS